MSQVTLSQRIHDDLAAIIASTDPGERLPAEPILAQQLGVSRASLREAMRTFETKGLIQRKQGSGTFVAHNFGAIDSGLEVLESIETLAERSGLNVSMGSLKTSTHLATEIEAANLEISAEDKVLHITRVINAEGCPVALLSDSLPLDILQEDEIDKQFTGSVLDLLLKRENVNLNSARTEMSAVSAPADISSALKIDPGDVLMRFNTWMYTTEGIPIVYSISHFLPSYFCFHIIRRINYGG